MIKQLIMGILSFQDDDEHDPLDQISDEPYAMDSKTFERVHTENEIEDED